MNCFRYLGFKSFAEVDKLEFHEYELLMKAYGLKQVDEKQKISMLAWQTVQAGATKKNGKPVYKQFKDFFDYDKEVEKVERAGKHQGNPKFSGLSKYLTEKESRG